MEPVSIAGAEILSGVTAIQNIRMRPAGPDTEGEERFVIPAHTLYGNYPPKIPEDEIKPVSETGEIVLSGSWCPNTSSSTTGVPGTAPPETTM